MLRVYALHTTEVCLLQEQSSFLGSLCDDAVALVVVTQCWLTLAKKPFGERKQLREWKKWKESGLRKREVRGRACGSRKQKVTGGLEVQFSAELRATEGQSQSQSPRLKPLIGLIGPCARPLSDLIDRSS